MPATTNDSRMPGPASVAATRPVMTKMPAPMMAPTPNDVSPIGPRIRRSRFSPSISACNCSSDFVANNPFNMSRSPRHLAGELAGRGLHPHGEQARRLNRRRRVPSPPTEIDRYPRQDNHEARPTVDRLHDQQAHHDH